MTKRKNIIIILILFFFAIIFLTNCEIICYGIGQGIGEFKILSNSKSIEKVLKTDQFPDSLKIKLKLVQEIRQFAIDSLGLKKSKNYTTVYDQKGDTIIWILYAAPKFKMEVHYWKYPIVGELPYIGFFKREKAIKEKKQLLEEGYDIRTGTVSAWSTLGYFKDPVLSNFLYESEGELAELIIHELTHLTIFIKGKAQFNENLATFIGQEGAKKFLESKYGKNSKEYQDYIGLLNDTKKVSEHMLRGALQLDSLYKTFNDDLDFQTKLKLKNTQIITIVENMDTLTLYNKKIPEKFKNKIKIINNAFFVGFITYFQKQNTFQNEYDFSYAPDLKGYIEHLKEAVKNNLTI